MYKAKNIDTDKALKRLKLIVVERSMITTVIYMDSKNITTVFKRVWILLKACLNALIMKRKRLERKKVVGNKFDNPELLEGEENEWKNI